MCLDTAKKGVMKYYLPDIYLEWAHLNLARGNSAKVQEYLDMAQNERDSMEGYRRSDRHVEVLKQMILTGVISDLADIKSNSSNSSETRSLRGKSA